jgi:hypothetical protein
VESLVCEDLLKSEGALGKGSLNEQSISVDEPKPRSKQMLGRFHSPATWARPGWCANQPSEGIGPSRSLTGYAAGRLHTKVPRPARESAGGVRKLVHTLKFRGSLDGKRGKRRLSRETNRTQVRAQLEFVESLMGEVEVEAGRGVRGGGGIEKGAARNPI